MRTSTTNLRTAEAPPAPGHESHDVSEAGTTVRADLTGRGAALRIGEGARRTTIEVTPTGPLAGDFFVGTFRGARIVALVRLSEDYETVRRVDLVQMVEAERDVSGYPQIAVVEEDGAKLLQVVGGGAPARLEIYPLPALPAV